MKNKTTSLAASILFLSSATTAQVQVSQEPSHKKVLENKYIRLLDVWLLPGDTSWFHIHSTPSLFVHFTTTVVCSQVKGKEWETGKNTQGNVSYRSFINDNLVHRVSNCDTVPFHVTDIEILSVYKPTTQLQPLPFSVLFDNEKTVAYRLTNKSFDNQIISDRGPMVAQLVSGDEVMYYDAKNKKATRIKTGKHLYIKPGSSFYFSARGSEEINLVIFEVK